MRKAALLLMLLASCANGPAVTVPNAPPPVARALAGTETFDPPSQSFALTPDVDNCPDAAVCRPHSPYGAWIGTATCLPQVTVDMAGVPRPNRLPNTLFQGDTGCDIGAYQFVSGAVPPLPAPGPPLNLRQAFPAVTTLAASPASSRAGNVVTVTWSGIQSPTSTDWVGLFTSGLQNIEYIDFVYVSCSDVPVSAIAS